MSDNGTKSWARFAAGCVGRLAEHCRDRHRELVGGQPPAPAATNAVTGGHKHHHHHHHKKSAEEEQKEEEEYQQLTKSDDDHCTLHSSCTHDAASVFMHCYRLFI